MPQKVFVLWLICFLALDGDHVLLGRHRDFVGANWQPPANLVAVVAEPFDVIGGGVVLAGALGGFNEVKRRSKPMVERQGEKVVKRA